MEVDYYYLLGIEEDATRKEIRSAYRRMAEIYHPDKLSQLPTDRMEEGQEIMRLLNEAKSILLNPEKREQYDMRIGAGMEPEEVMIIEKGPSSNYEDRMVAIEKETVAKKMSRVLDSMKDVFVKDKEFQTKIAVAEEVFEAQILDEEEEEPMEVMVLDEDEEIEMKLQFTVVQEKKKDKIPVNHREEDPKKKKFRILAIEGDDTDDISEDDEVDVEWE